MCSAGRCGRLYFSFICNETVVSLQGLTGLPTTYTFFLPPFQSGGNHCRRHAVSRSEPRDSKGTLDVTPGVGSGGLGWSKSNSLRVMQRGEKVRKRKGRQWKWVVFHSSSFWCAHKKQPAGPRRPIRQPLPSSKAPPTCPRSYVGPLCSAPPPFSHGSNHHQHQQHHQEQQPSPSPRMPRHIWHLGTHSHSAAASQSRHHANSFGNDVASLKLARLTQREKEEQEAKKHNNNNKWKKNARPHYSSLSRKK